MNDICLTADELYNVTHRKQSQAQHAALIQMRIPARLRPDGSVLVFRSDLSPTTAARASRDTDEPDFGALRRGSA